MPAVPGETAEHGGTAGRGATAQLVDTHCHLYFDRFDADRAGVIRAMDAAGVCGAVVVGIDEASTTQSQQLAVEYPQLRYSAGLHPGSSFPEAFDPEDYFGRWFADGALQPVAIGECGIDLYREGNPLERQQAVFVAQLEYAARHDLPVIVHTRSADRETRECLEQVPAARGILHCFNGSELLLEFALDAGWYVSFAGNLTFPKAQELRDAALRVPLERLLVETDAPFLAPQPVRGRRCEPAHVVHTAELLSGLRGIEPETLNQALLENSRECFGVNWGADEH
jgi:TatD DNase family protein